MTQKPSENPATPSSAHKVMSPRIARVDAIMGGSEGMRQSGLLKPHAAEDPIDFENREQAATLFEMGKLTLNSWTGRPFSDPVSLGDNPDARDQELAEDIDLQGNNLHVFASNWFRWGLAHGIRHTLVEYPRQEETEGVRTRGDDRAEGLRPYWVDVPAASVIFAYGDMVNGREELSHLRIMEVVTTMNGFEEVNMPRIKVWDVPGSGGNDGAETRVQTWIPDGPAEKDEWILADEWTIGIAVIPLVTFYGGEREGMHQAQPALAGVADLNIAHFVSDSDQRNILTVTRFPVLAATGISEGEGAKREFGPRRMLWSERPEAKFFFLEHSGAAIEAGERDMSKLEERGAHYGAEFMRKRPGNETAAARILDSAESTSPLQDSALRFQDSLANAYQLTALWENRETDTEPTVVTDYRPSELPEGDRVALLEARKNGDLSRLRFLSILNEHQVLGDDFDVEENARELATEMADLPGATDVDLEDDDDDGDPTPSE